MTDTSTMPDAWHLDSGLVDDMILDIHASYFATHADYQDGKQLMLWLIGTDENGDPQEVRMSIGADWTTDDGNIVTHPTKKKQHINKNSIYGFFLQFAFQIPDLTRVLIERGEALGGLGPRDARVWTGLRLHLQNRELKWGRGIDPQERLMPTEFLGLVTDTPQPPAQAPVVQVPVAAPGPPVQQPAPAPAPAAPPAGIPPVPPPAPPATVPTPNPADLVAAARAAAAQPAVSNGSPLFARAIDLAKNSADFSTFLNAALGDPDILADEELAIQCADQTQIWAAAHSGG